MVSHCANPNCNKPLHYLREGKVFLFSRTNASKQNSKTLQLLEYYWLCGACSNEWTLTMDGENGIQVVERKRRRFRATYRAPSAAPAL
ncbi:MAG: hypothetical protein ACYCPO_04530 [Acidobacteriaceae bacterium]